MCSGPLLGTQKLSASSSWCEEFLGKWAEEGRPGPLLHFKEGETEARRREVTPRAPQPSSKKASPTAPSRWPSMLPSGALTCSFPSYTIRMFIPGCACSILSTWGAAWWGSCPSCAQSEKSPGALAEPQSLQTC